MRFAVCLLIFICGYLAVIYMAAVRDAEREKFQNQDAISEQTDSNDAGDTTAQPANLASQFDAVMTRVNEANGELTNRLAHISDGEIGRRIVRQRILLEMLREIEMQAQDFTGQISWMKYETDKESDQLSDARLIGRLALGRQLLLDINEAMQRLDGLESSSAYLAVSDISLDEGLQQLDVDYGFQAVERISKEFLKPPEERLGDNDVTSYAEETRCMVAKVMEEIDSIEADIDDCESEMQRKQELAEKAAAGAELQWQLERDWPSIKLYLSALFAKGYSQPYRVSEHQKTPSKQPFSITALREISALESSSEGLHRLISTVKAPSNDREYGAFPVWLESDQSTYKHEFSVVAQGLLIKYGDLLLERQLLAP